MSGFQRVDLPADHRVERLRQGRVDALTLDDPQRLLKEKRVAGGSTHDRLYDVRPHRCRIGHRPHEVLGRLSVQRLDYQGLRAGRSEAALPWPPERQHEPTSRWRRDDALKELGRCLINPLGVLDDDHRRPHESPLEQPEQRRRETIAPEARLDHVDLPGGRHGEVGHFPEERQLAEELGRDLGDAAMKLRGHALRRGALDADECAHRIAQRPVGHRCPVRLAPNDKDVDTATDKTLVHEPRFARAGVPDQHHGAAATRGKHFEVALDHPELRLSPHERELVPITARS